MSYFEKSINLSIFDLIIVALFGGLLTIAIAKLFSSLLKYLYIKLKKPGKKLYKSLKEFLVVREKKRLIKEFGYDQALYNETKFCAKYRYLFPTERRYLKTYEEQHKKETTDKAKKFRKTFHR